MKKFLLSCVVVVLVLAANAQAKMSKPNPFKTLHKEHAVVLQNQQSYSPVSHQHRASRSGTVVNSRLHSELIGSAGNLLTIIEGGCNQVDVNDSLNLVTFIHRNDDAIYGGTVSQYRYDVSHDRGNNWEADLGVITNAVELLDNTGAGVPKGRFPQGGIFNPAGNTVADSAYLIYSGTYHNDDNWIGHVRGRGKISGDTGTYNCNIAPIPSSTAIAIGTGFCHGAPGVFWNLTRDYTGGFTAGTPIITNGWIVEKGVWNTSTKDIDWTQQAIPTPFVTDLVGTTTPTQASVVGVPNIAFDPTGQYGWIASLGDITNDLDSVYDPILWKSTDFGATWQGPIRIDLDSLSEVMGQLGTDNEVVPGTAASGIPTAWGDDGDLVVDAWGNPHFVILVGNGGGYGIEFAGLDMWDLTYNANISSTCGGWNNWHALYLDSLHTLQGDMTAGGTNDPLAESNRPMASASADGKRVFFFWTETDPLVLSGGTQMSGDNSLPNLYGRGVDPQHFVFTKVFSYTEGDALWGGETLDSVGGAYGGAKYGTVSPVALTNGENYNVPLVLTQIDYNTDLTQGLGSSEAPAAFWYINNINFLKTDFKEGLAADVEINGNAEVTVTAGGTYTEDGATLTYLDTACYFHGLLHLVIDSGNFNANVGGVYVFGYYAEDANGNIYAADTRTVTVVDKPIADFVYSYGTPNGVNFSDQSLNVPTSWNWDFGDGSAHGTSQNPTHTYSAVGSYTVCLIATNTYGSDTTCKSVTITSIPSGISETEFSQSISMFPNPTTGKVAIMLNGTSTPEFAVAVYNVLGETVLSTTKYKAGTNRVELNLTNAASGMYLVKIQSNKGIAVKYLTVGQ